MEYDLVGALNATYHNSYLTKGLERRPRHIVIYVLSDMLEI